MIILIVTIKHAKWFAKASFIINLRETFFDFVNTLMIMILLVLFVTNLKIYVVQISNLYQI